jgi:hypothetical protein
VLAARQKEKQCTCFIENMYSLDNNLRHNLSFSLNQEEKKIYHRVSKLAGNKRDVKRCL